jgi:periplasmic protein TonB
MASSPLIHDGLQNETFERVTRDRIALLRAPPTVSNSILRTLALAGSLAAHLGVGIFAYVRAPQPPKAPPLVEGEPTFDVSLAPSVDPDATSAPAAPRDSRVASQALASARWIAAATLRGTGPSQPTNTADPSAPAVPVERAQPPTPHFVVQAPVVSGGNAQAAPVGPVSGRLDAHGEPIAEGQVDRPAKLQSGNPPAYTRAAEAARVEVELPLEVVVDRTGSVQSARTLEHVGYGLDEAAVGAVRRYHFSPAWRAGKPVAVRMRWLLRFQLR